MSTLSRDEVESAVRSYWAVTAAREADRQQNAYRDDAFIFTSESKRLEPARLVSMRRRREYLNGKTKIHIDLPAQMEICILSSESAVAAYNLRFHSEMKPTAGTINKSAEEYLLNARVTQVFARDENGSLRIVHEHISAPQQ